MQITIIKNNKLILFTLPTKISGSYWITDDKNGKKINLVNIEATENGWNLISNQDAFLIDDKEVMQPFALLKNYCFYTLKNNYKNEIISLYCSPIYDSTFKEFIPSANEIVSVGSGSNTLIRFPFKGISEEVFTLEKKQEGYRLCVKDEQALLFVNRKRAKNNVRILYGDVIFLYGLKIILMQRDGKDYFLINNPNGLLGAHVSYANVMNVPSTFQDRNEEITEEILEDDYFYRTPYFYQTLKPFVLQIDAPPGKKEEDRTPAILTVGPMITMSMMSVVMLLSTLSSGRSIKDSWTSILMCIVMLLSSLLWPLATKTYQKFSDKRYEKKRQNLYQAYLDKKENEIDKELNIQKRTLMENNLTILECQNIIKSKNAKLWQKRITDHDFLTIPVGIGNQPMQIEIKYPEEHFSLLEDNLLNMVHTLGERERILRDVPITYSFFQNIATGIVGEASTTKEFMDRVLLQMTTLYGYDELKIVMLTSEENENLWDYVKILPHSWSNDSSFRFFGASNDDYREIIYNLDKLFHERKSKNNSLKNVPHYVIVTDAIKSIDGYDLIKNIMTQPENCGFSIIMLVDRISACPNECKNFINVSRGECAIFNSILNENTQKFTIDFSSTEELYSCSRMLANTKIEIKSEAETRLPEVYHFLEMYQVGKVEQLNVFDRWKKSNPILSLQTPVGIGKSGEVITLDLHEKYHGPHGLIAGTTGSGKSEFIITYVLSLAVNYSPYEVQIILIDYKGGGLAGAFNNDKYTLPHLAGVMTNLDGNELNRSLASIESEVKRRQREFNEARLMTNESTIDIYKYQKLFREGRLKGKGPIAHLFIISDEFAELKEQQPEFMDKLISVARVGRSLGVHLILATQKPGGVVDQQIWSNTRFRVCLKVQDTSDSQEVLKKPDAAYLKKIGRFYLQVGYDEVYTLGQSAWAGGKYIPRTILKREVDSSVSLLNNIGMVTLSRENKKEESNLVQGEEITNVVKYLSDMAKKENIKIRKLWLEKIPALIYVDSLKNKYNYTKENFVLNPVIGEYDDPDSQNQYLLTIPFSKLGNALVYGIAGSGKEDFLLSLLYSGMSTYSVAELSFYLLDFGAEALRVFESSPYVGGFATLNDGDKIKNLFKMLNEELMIRKKNFARFGGDYFQFLKNSQETIPNYIVTINNYEAFVENYEELNDELAILSREAYKYGIYFVLTANNESSVRMRIKQNFSLIYVLQQNNDMDYSSILGNCRGKIPAKIKGRGLFKRDKIFEFQTAHIVEENDMAYLKEMSEQLALKSVSKAKPIPVLPEVVNYSYVKNAISNATELVVGVAKNELSIQKYNLNKNVIDIISSYEIENVNTFLHAIINQICYQNYYSIFFINTTEQVFENFNLKGKYFDKNVESLFNKIVLYIENVYATYEQNHFDEELLKKQQKIVCFIYGVYNFINKLSPENKQKLNDIMKKNVQMNLVDFIIVDNPDVIKNYAYEEWFKMGCDTSKGIWIGSGIAEQSIFKVSKMEREDREEIPNNFGYVINNAKITKIKLLTDFNVTETL